MQIAGLAGIVVLIVNAIGFFWLAGLNHDVTWNSRLFGTISILHHGQEISPACKYVLVSLDLAEKSLKSEDASVNQLQDAALQFDKTKGDPGLVRFWGETGHVLSEQNWERVKAAKDALESNLNRFNSAAQQARADCLK